MWRTIVLLAVATSAFCAEESDLFKECREPVPISLKDTYKQFATAARDGKPEKFCLPNSVAISTASRPDKSKEYGQDLNIPFLKSLFSVEVFSARKDADDCWLLRTGTSAIWFVQTKNGDWRIYRYVDKPIQ